MRIRIQVAERRVERIRGQRDGDGAKVRLGYRIEAAAVIEVHELFPSTRLAEPVHGCLSERYTKGDHPRWRDALLVESSGQADALDGEVGVQYAHDARVQGACIQLAEVQVPVVHGLAPGIGVLECGLLEDGVLGLHGRFWLAGYASGIYFTGKSGSFEYAMKRQTVTRGRPPLAPEQRRQRRVVTFLRDEEFTSLCHYAERLQLSLSAACHRLLGEALDVRKADRTPKP